MNNSRPYLPFNALQAPLSGSNLIEASAGTGKTYSIAILVLRLVLEQRLPIKEILMVTFTKAAVAELETRIRLFIRTASKASNGHPISDPNIGLIVKKAIEESSANEVQQCLRDAVLFLDETSVLTIHSFCQNTLNEFAFETNQLFGTEMLADIKPVIEEEFNKFWRKKITTLPVDFLKIIISQNLRTGMMKAIEEHLSGKNYAGFDAGFDYSINAEDCIQCAEESKEAHLKAQQFLEHLHQRILTERADLENRCAKGAAKKALEHLLDSPADFLNLIKVKRTTVYVSAGFADWLALADEHDQKVMDANEIGHRLLAQLYCAAVQEVTKGVWQFKLRNNLLSYDDMIANLHYALVAQSNTALVAALKSKYKAVFIDEFQDTDRQQFEIFDTAFGKDTILFYIGDPKQSIYAWRKADIFTYFKARERVDALYSMNENYRSSALLIPAMNSFFLPEKDFDTFYFGAAADSIKYQEVDSPLTNKKGLLTKEGEAEVPISIFNCPKKDKIIEAVAAQVALLLSPNTFSINKEAQQRALRPSDIGILVRTGKEGSSVKAALAAKGIPATTIDDAKVLQSDEATALLHTLVAMATPDRSTINRALIAPFTQLSIATVLTIDDEFALGKFTGYRQAWQEHGVYTAIMNFIADFGVRDKLLSADVEQGERALTNLYQLAELLHQVQTRKDLAIPEVLAWLKKGIDGMATDGDEFEQRIENDEEAVKIVTIHKSKGLEYNIVLAPFLDFVPPKNISFFSYRDPDTGAYVGVEKTRMTPQQQLLQAEQAEQENRRLLYVAITRAVYKCYLFRNCHYSGSTLATFVTHTNSANPEHITVERGLPNPPSQGYKTNSQRLAAPARLALNFKLKNQGWRKLSYTFLAAKGIKTIYGKMAKTTLAYDQFIFGDLKRGIKTGDLLHYILERISFGEETRWESVLTDGLKRFAPARQEDWLPMFHEMMQHVLKTTIAIEDARFSLSEIAWNRRIPEFEFDFPVNPFTTTQLQDLSDEEAGISVKYATGSVTSELEGIMNGKIDLFFEHNGRYYLLDWKSNYLGSSLEDYNHAALNNAMNESNYHLQYLIYCVAVKKYLSSRIQGFDYERDFGGVIYLFLRGMRHGEQTGIFTRKPSASKIANLEQILNKESIF